MKKRLYRSESNRMISGVCGGIAEYFNIDATIIRIIWAVLACFWGAGILLYIICMIVIPTESDIDKTTVNHKSGTKNKDGSINADSEEKDNNQ